MPPETSLLEPRAWRRAALLVPVVFVVALMFHLLVVQGFPNSADEYAYLWQAEAFARGWITAEIPQPRDTFAFFHLGDLEGRRFSRFPPGWPLLLTSGVWWGVPGIVNPLLAALALAGIYRLACAWVGERAAALGVMLTGLSPFFLLNAASYHSHPSSLFALTVLALALSVGLERHRAGPYLVAGMAFGLAVIIRPYTALLLGIPLVVVLGGEMVRRSSGASTFRGEGEGRSGGSHARALLWFLLGGMPFAALLAVVNHQVTGRWYLLATRYLDPEEGIGFGVHGHTLGQGMQNTLLWSIEALAYTFFLSPLLLFAARGRAGVRSRLLWVLLAAPVVGYLFYWNPGGNRYGPRFWFEALLPFTLLSGVGLERVLSVGRYRVLLGAGALFGLVMVGKLAIDTRTQIDARMDPYRRVAAAGLDQAVVLLLSGAGDMPVYDLTRNPPDFERARVLYGRGRGGADLEVARDHPTRQLYYYRWDGEEGRLWPFDPGRVEPPAPLPDR